MARAFSGGACTALLVLATCLTGPFCRPAAGGTPGGDGLAAFVPAEALVFIERRGHTAVRGAMQASNFGPIAADAAIQKFVNDSRVNLGKRYARDVLDLKDPDDVDARQKQVDEVLKAFWRQPAAFCLVADREASSPSTAFLCATGDYRASCRTALEALMKVDVPPEGVAGTKQAFTYRKGEVLWKGVVKRGSAFVLPKAAPERAEALNEAFMVCWVDDLLVIATGRAAADAMSGVLSVTAPAPSLAADPTYQAVAARTGIADWAFRWHVAVQAAMGGPATRDAEGRRRRDIPEELAGLGLDRIVAVGGTEGYADKVVTRRTLVYAPAADLTMRLIRPGGTYQRGLAMAPRGAVLSVAGEIDVDVLARLIAPPGPTRRERRRMEAESRPATEPADKTADSPDQATAAITRLVRAGDGNMAAYMVDLQLVIGRGARSVGVPAGVVMGLKDPRQARRAVDLLVKLIPPDAADDTDIDDEGKPATRPAAAGATRPAGVPELYRATPIQRAGMARIAILKDRLVVAFSREALAAGVDAALDNTGGLPADGKARALADLDGQGALLARVDMAKVVQTVWPLLPRDNRGGDFPLVSLPTTEKMVSLLGSEVALVQAVDVGILLKSRGSVPLLTKAPMAVTPLFWFLMMMR